MTWPPSLITFRAKITEREKSPNAIGASPKHPPAPPACASGASFLSASEAPPFRCHYLAKMTYSIAEACGLSHDLPQAWEGRRELNLSVGPPPTTPIPACGDPNRRKAPGGSTELTLTSTLHSMPHREPIPIRWAEQDFKNARIGETNSALGKLRDICGNCPGLPRLTLLCVFVQASLSQLSAIRAVTVVAMVGIDADAARPKLNVLRKGRSG
jgi:hypothetical protein